VGFRLAGLCRLRANYDAWRDAAGALTAHLSAEEQAQVFGGTAIRFYRLGV